MLEIGKLLSVGKLWESGSHRRVYINNLSDYVSGYSELSNNEKNKFKYVKIWYDLNTGKWNMKSLSRFDYGQEIVDNVEKIVKSAQTTNQQSVTKTCWECGMEFTKGTMRRNGDWEESYCGC